MDRSIADSPPPGNAEVAALLREMAALLERQGDNPFRVGAYRRAADTVEGLSRSVAELDADEGVPGLDALPAVGATIAAAIDEIVRTGHWTRLERLRAAAQALAQEDTGLAVPPPAPRTPPAPGATAAAARPGEGAAALPPVAELLQVDAEYRSEAAAGRLPRIAPLRFNPQRQAWLPVLHARRGPWHYTALFSNTARAHALGRVHDWVVVYAEDPAHGERPFTVVTAQRGALAGRRVVRGRETECRAWYAQGDAADAGDAGDAPGRLRSGP